MGFVILVGLLNYWSFIPTIICAVGMFILRSRFTQCLRDLRRIEGITRSPIYSYLSSTISGLKVIRSYYAEKMCSKEFLLYLDHNTRANFLIMTITRWAAIRLECLTLSFLTLVTLSSILVRFYQHMFSTVDIALTLSYTLSLLGFLQWTIRFD